MHSYYFAEYLRGASVTVKVEACFMSLGLGLNFWTEQVCRFKYDFLHRRITHPKFDQTEVRTCDLQIMDSTFHVTERLILTTKSSAFLLTTDVSSYNNSLNLVVDILCAISM